MDATSASRATRYTSSLRSQTAFFKWFRNLPKRHIAMILISVLVLVVGMIDLLLNLFGITTWLFWTNDILVIFGGIILLQIALVYAIKAQEQ